MAQNNTKTSTSTQIRNMYSDGISYMNIKFYNTNLSFQLYPCIGKDPGGKFKYDTRGQQTTVNFEGAFALYKTSKDIIEGKVQEVSVAIPCFGATLTLARNNVNGVFETTFTLSKNNTDTSFKFQTTQQQVKENGNVVTKTIESGLGAFMKTIEGYLTGINADRHLNKLTEDYAKLQESNGTQSGGSYKPNNNFKRPNNNYGGGWKNNQSSLGPAQSFADYKLPAN